MCLGLWSRYRNNDWPSKNGFAAGTDRFGNTAYVGRGNYADMLLAGRLQITSPPGVYVPYPTEPISTQPDYLVVPNNCNCVWLPYATAVTKVGLVRSIDYDFQYAVGRKTFANGQVTVTSVRTTDMIERWVDVTGTYGIGIATELLVCETP